MGQHFHLRPLLHTRRGIYDRVVFLFAPTLFVFMFTRPGFFGGHVYVRVYDIADDVSLLASACSKLQGVVLSIPWLNEAVS